MLVVVKYARLALSLKITLLIDAELLPVIRNIEGS